MKNSGGSMPPLIGQMSRFGHLGDDIAVYFGNVKTLPWFEPDAGIDTGPAVDVSFSPSSPFQPSADVAEAEQGIPDGFFASFTPAGSMRAGSMPAGSMRARSSSGVAPGPAWLTDPFAGASPSISQLGHFNDVPHTRGPLAPARTTNQDRP